MLFSTDVIALLLRCPGNVLIFLIIILISQLIEKIKLKFWEPFEISKLRFARPITFPVDTHYHDGGSFKELKDTAMLPLKINQMTVIQ